MPSCSLMLVDPLIYQNRMDVFNTYNNIQCGMGASIAKFMLYRWSINAIILCYLKIRTDLLFTVVTYYTFGQFICYSCIILREELMLKIPGNSHQLVYCLTKDLLHLTSGMTVPRHLWAGKQQISSCLQTEQELDAGNANRSGDHRSGDY